MATEKKYPMDMVNNSNLGKWMKWADIINLYPNRWVFITNLKLDETDNLIGGVLEVVCKDSEVDLVKDILTDKSKKGCFERTTELPGNILWVE